MSPGVLARLCFDTHKYSFHGCNLPMGELMQAGHFAKHNSQVLGRIDVTAMKWVWACLGHFWWSMMIQRIDKIELGDKNHTFDF